MWPSEAQNRTINAEKPPKKAVFLKKVVRVTGFEPAASCSQTYWEYFFHLFIAVFSRFLFVLLTLWRSYLRCFRVLQRRLW